jgi:hypothetical protein
MYKRIGFEAVLRIIALILSTGFASAQDSPCKVEMPTGDVWKTCEQGVRVPRHAVAQASLRTCNHRRGRSPRSRTRTRRKPRSLRRRSRNRIIPAISSGPVARREGIMLAGGGLSANTMFCGLRCIACIGRAMSIIVSISQAKRVFA